MPNAFKNVTNGIAYRRWLLAANPGLKLLDTAYVEESYAIGIGKGNTELKDAINTALEELKADGTLQAIVDKYITAE